MTESIVDNPSRSAAHHLGIHIVAMAIVLIAVLAVIEPDQSFSADEGAAIVQAELLLEGTWTMPHPVPVVDPDGEWFPLEASVMTDEGFAPYVKHPAYPLVLVPFASLGGQVGMVGASTAATLLAAVAGALLVRRWNPALDVVTFWTLGIASPLFFNGYLVIAHTLAAAACGFGAIALLRSLDAKHRPSVPLGAACLLFAVAVLLRSEAVLLVGGLALGVALCDESPRTRRLLVGLVLACSGAAAYVVDARATQWVLGSSGIDPFTIKEAGEGFVASRFTGFVISWLLPVVEFEDTLGAALIFAVGVLAFGFGLALRRRSDLQLLLVLAVAAATLTVVRLLLYPVAVVPGLLPAFPILCAALPLLWPDRDLRHGRAIVAGCGVFTVAVLGTQYASAGSSQWGGRYFAIALVLVVPLALADLDRATLGVFDDRRAVVGAGVVVSVGLAITAVLGLQSHHVRVADAAVVIVAAVDAAGGDPVVVATRPAVPRLAHDILDEGRWLLVPDGDLDQALGRLSSAGEEDVLVVTEPENVDVVAGAVGYTIAADDPTSEEGNLRVLRLEAR